MINLIDKRSYAINYPTTNIVINQALAVANKTATTEDLIQIMRNSCVNNNDALINVALNLAPNYEVSNLIWQALHQALNFNAPNQLTSACLFAIPIVIVAGSKEPRFLNGNLDNQVLNDFFLHKQIINPGDHDWFISSRLVDAKTIGEFKPSQYYYWVRNINNAKLWLPVDIAGSQIRVHNEGVFVRFLIGVISGVNGNNDINQLINFNNYRSSSKELMDMVLKQLKTDAVTLFPIPFEPCYLSMSYAIGDNYRKEIALAVSLSNLVRKIKQENLTPLISVIMLNNQIEIKLSSKEPSIYQELYYWQLTLYDDLAYIQDKLNQLVTDLQLDYQILD
jgi:hypothetical protein